ncbi:uncharacterized protein LOC135813082 [Sycon ciliatum]|uniref:uncharacterized protein LOC135813082 n=1 Tax=Sycon ciliatum TaxID=27933 RepID=UPI0031F642D6
MRDNPGGLGALFVSIFGCCFLSLPFKSQPPLTGLEGSLGGLVIQDAAEKDATPKTVDNPTPDESPDGATADQDTHQGTADNQVGSSASDVDESEDQPAHRSPLRRDSRFYTLKHREFIRVPMGTKLVDELPGIDRTATANLETSRITRASQIFDRYQAVERDCARFKAEMWTLGNVNELNAEGCYKALHAYNDKFKAQKEG